MQVAQHLHVALRLHRPADQAVDQVDASVAPDHAGDDGVERSLAAGHHVGVRRRRARSREPRFWSARAAGVDPGAEADVHRRDEAHRHAVGDDRGVHGVAASGLRDVGLPEVGLPERWHRADARIGDVRVRVLHAGADRAGDGDDVGGVVGVLTGAAARRASAASTAAPWPLGGSCSTSWSWYAPAIGVTHSPRCAARSSSVRQPPARCTASTAASPHAPVMCASRPPRPMARNDSASATLVMR